MDAFDCIATKLETREFDSGKNVPPDVKSKVLEAARLTGSSNNSQHWHFILVQDKRAISQLADDSTTGKWVRGCNFAVIITTNPKIPAHMIDAGRALQDMQLAAWNSGVASGIFTGVNAEKLKADFGIPQEMNPTVFVGFGYPAKKRSGKKKNRKALGEIAFLDRYGQALNPSSLK